MEVQKKERKSEKQILKENRGPHGKAMESEGIEWKNDHQHLNIAFSPV